MLDLALPDGDGEAILRAIRRRGLACRVVVVTAGGRDFDSRGSDSARRASSYRVISQASRPFGSRTRRTGSVCRQYAYAGWGLAWNNGSVKSSWTS